MARSVVSQHMPLFKNFFHGNWRTLMSVFRFKFDFFFPVLNKIKISDHLHYASKNLQFSACRMWVDAFLILITVSPLATALFALKFAYISCLTNFLPIFLRALH
jgi:hypothetical protein